MKIHYRIHTAKICYPLKRRDGGVYPLNVSLPETFWEMESAHDGPAKTDRADPGTLSHPAAGRLWRHGDRLPGGGYQPGARGRGQDLLASAGRDAGLPAPFRSRGA